MPGFEINISDNIDAFRKTIAEKQENEIPFVTAFALTRTAQDILREEVAVEKQVFDRPTPFTLNALYVKPATKKSLTAAVMFKEGFNSVPAWRYLGPEIEGGPRAKKSHERALERAGFLRTTEFCVPGRGVELDQYGNMRGGDITRLLSGLGANPDAHQNTTKRSRSLKRNRTRGTYFLSRGAKIPDGIYMRQGTREIVPMLIFVSQPRYEKRMPFFETADRIFKRNFAMNFRIGWNTYVVNKSSQVA